jgi:hypothetical protein
MSDVFLLLAAALVVLAWIGVAYVIRHWGAGFGARSVRCPHKDRRATISTFSHVRNGWGTVVDREVLQCSLLGSGPVTCDKSCLTQLR